MGKRRQNGRSSSSTPWKRTGVKLAIVVILVLLLRGFAFTSCLIPSAGMEDSILPGERILVNKWSYGLRIPFMSIFSYHRWGESPVKDLDIVVFNNPFAIQQPLIDRREVYISRCIGLPGDTLLVDSLFSVVSPTDTLCPKHRRLFAYPPAKEALLTTLMQTLSIPNEGIVESNDTLHTRRFGFYQYHLLKQALHGQKWLHPAKANTACKAHPLVVPSKGKALRVYPWNITLLRNTLVMHEGKQAEIKNDTLYVNGQPTQYCYFTKNYYWMGANHAANLSDSRLFGFVPQDHIIGKASLIWYSKKKSTGYLEGYRWERFFTSVQ